MNDAKYIGLDVHQATISASVLDSSGKLLMEAILATKAETTATLRNDMDTSTGTSRREAGRLRRRARAPDRLLRSASYRGGLKSK
jgi:hypothetical protein